MVIAIVAVGMYATVKNNWLPQPVAEFFGKGDSDLRTYYQWQDGRGNLRISREPPADGRVYSTFLGSPDLVTNEDIERLSSQAVEEKSSKQDSFELTEQPKIKVIKSYRDTLRERLVQREVTTQCRWLINQLFEIEREVINYTQRENKIDTSQLCRDYRAQMNLLSVKNCKVREEDIQGKYCR